MFYLTWRSRFQQSLADSYHFTKQNGLGCTCLLGPGLLFFRLISIFGFRPVKFPRLSRYWGPELLRSYCRYQNYLEWKNELYVSSSSSPFSIFRKMIFFFFTLKFDPTCQLRTSVLRVPFKTGMMRIIHFLLFYMQQQKRKIKIVNG